jgi:phosphotransferase system enzyme I (PtsP)
MFPMIADVAEFAAARALVDRELDRLAARGLARPAAVRVDHLGPSWPG